MTSWGQGIRKKIDRGTIQLRQKIGNVDKITDRAFDAEERRYKAMTESAKALEKESRRWLDAVRVLANSQCRIAETVDAFYGDAGAKYGLSHNYKKAVDELDKATISALDGPYRSCVLDPISRFCTYFKDVDEAAKTRKSKLLDYESLSAKVKELSEKPEKDPLKLPLAQKEKAIAEKLYAEQNSALMADMPELVAARVPFLNPSFEAMIKIQMRLSSEAYSLLNKVQEYLPPDATEQYSDGRMQDRIEQVLQEVRDLSICDIDVGSTQA